MRALAAIAVCLLALAGSASAAEDCGDAAELIPAWPSLDKTVLELRRGKALVILAIGSSSTLGEAASVPGAAWPARLQEELSRRLPSVPVKVVNKARRRQSASQMLEQLEADVKAAEPALVIWESGTAEAVRGNDVEAYRAVLLEGVEWLQHRGIDVILMDMQFARGPAAVINFEPYHTVVRETAEMQDVAYFPRLEIMRAWVESGRFVLEDLTRAQQAKVADMVYACIAQLLAGAIVRSAH